MQGRARVRTHKVALPLGVLRAMLALVGVTEAGPTHVALCVMHLLVSLLISFQKQNGYPLHSHNL